MIWATAAAPTAMRRALGARGPICRGRQGRSGPAGIRRRAAIERVQPPYTAYTAYTLPHCNARGRRCPVAAAGRLYEHVGPPAIQHASKPRLRAAWPATRCPALLTSTRCTNLPSQQASAARGEIRSCAGFGSLPPARRLPAPRSIADGGAEGAPALALRSRLGAPVDQALKDAGRRSLGPGLASMCRSMPDAGRSTMCASASATSDRPVALPARLCTTKPRRVTPPPAEPEVVDNWRCSAPPHSTPSLLAAQPPRQAPRSGQ